MENPPPHFQGPGLLILTPQLRCLPAPELTRIYCITPQREGSCGLNSPRSLTLLRRLLRSQRREPLAIPGPQPDPSGSPGPGASVLIHTDGHANAFAAARIPEDFPGGPVVPVHGVWVQFLVGELGSRVVCGGAKR